MVKTLMNLEKEINADLFKKSAEERSSLSLSFESYIDSFVRSDVSLQNAFAARGISISSGSGRSDYFLVFQLTKDHPIGRYLSERINPDKKEYTLLLGNIKRKRESSMNGALIFKAFYCRSCLETGMGYHELAKHIEQVLVKKLEPSLCALSRMEEILSEQLSPEEEERFWAAMGKTVVSASEVFFSEVDKAGIENTKVRNGLLATWNAWRSNREEGKK